MEIAVAGQADLPHLARLLWLHAAAHERDRQPLAAFAADLGTWWADHEGTHVAFVARTTAGEVVGMAWLALLPRPPRPGAVARVSADVQSVFVLPEHRGQGVGVDLVRSACARAAVAGAQRVTVSSSSRAVPLYQRLGFASSRQLLERTADGGPPATNPLRPEGGRLSREPRHP